MISLFYLAMFYSDINNVILLVLLFKDGIFKGNDHHDKIDNVVY